MNEHRTIQHLIDTEASLRTQLAEAVALLRAMTGNLHYWQESRGVYPINAMRHRTAQAVAFLARIDGKGGA